MSKKIALLADFPWSFFDNGATGRGGGQHTAWLACLADEFRQVKSYEIHWVILDRSKGARAEIKQWDNQYFHRVPGVRVSIDLLLSYRLAKLSLTRKIELIDPDLVHCCGSERAYGVVIDGARPSVFSMQGILRLLEARALLPDSWQWRKICKWEEVFLRSANMVTCESKWGMAELKKIYPGLKLRQVEYGVHPDFYDVEWDPCAEKPFALFVGTINRGKGVDILIDAVESIQDRGWCLKIAGIGPLMPELMSKEVTNVEWLGNICWEELRKQLANAQCLVLPTRADTSPNVVKEARVVGVPVITSIHGGQSDYIFDGDNGIIVDPLNVANLRCAISRVMGDRGLAIEMGAAHKAEAREWFKASRTAEEFVKVYDEVLGAQC